MPKFFKHNDRDHKEHIGYADIVSFELLPGIWVDDDQITNIRAQKRNQLQISGKFSFCSRGQFSLKDGKIAIIADESQAIIRHPSGILEYVRLYGALFLCFLSLAGSSQEPSHWKAFAIAVNNDCGAGWIRDNSTGLTAFYGSDWEDAVQISEQEFECRKIDRDTSPTPTDHIYRPPVVPYLPYWKSNTVHAVRGMKPFKLFVHGIEFHISTTPGILWINESFSVLINGKAEALGQDGFFYTSICGVPVKDIYCAVEESLQPFE